MYTLICAFISQHHSTFLTLANYLKQSQGHYSFTMLPSIRNLKHAWSAYRKHLDGVFCIYKPTDMTTGAAVAILKTKIINGKICIVLVITISRFVQVITRLKQVNRTLWHTCNYNLNLWLFGKLQEHLFVKTELRHLSATEICTL